MKIYEKPLPEIIELAVYKGVQKGTNKVVVYVPPRYVPPIPPYRSVKVESDYGQVRIFCKPARSGGWLFEVKFNAALFNPAIPREVGEALLKKKQ